MSELENAPPSALHAYILVAFTHAFGAPARSMGKDMQWGVRASPTAPPVNVLVNGSNERPIVWLFCPQNNPLDMNDGVHHQSIMDEDSVARVVLLIQDKVTAAATPRPQPPGNPVQ
jgi:hypothetical protein